MLVESVMSELKAVASPSTTIAEVWKLIFSNKVNAIPVIDQKKKLVGIITKDDLLTALFPNYEEYITDFETAAEFAQIEKRITTSGKLIAKDIMKTHVIFVTAKTPLMRALSRMIVHHVDQVPVMKDDEHVIGIITKGDIFRALFLKRF